MNVVWFKRDLRTIDHAPLYEAARTGLLLGLYAYEPEVVGQSDYSALHHGFINECLAELRDRMTELGAVLLIRKGSVLDVLDTLHAEYGDIHLYSHREIGTEVTYQRDREVAAWIQAHGYRWSEYSQNGVIRKLKDRDGWARRWSAKMREPIVEEPVKMNSPAVKQIGEILPAESFQLEVSCPEEIPKKDVLKEGVQRGGSVEAEHWLESFLGQRGRLYRSSLSSPLSALEACSRVSPYLAWGALSIRQVYQKTVKRRKELKSAPEPDARWLKSLNAFLSRLNWHCHFMQKLEDQPNLNCVNMARSYDSLRRDSWNEHYFQAWCTGQTGYPMIDACMRALCTTGYLNFRMRAMLMSFSSYHLWLDWKRPGEYLARCFLDYEPGIHWSQVQMQSGTTGMNTVRVYSPIKQAEDQDPEGEFIRKWVPELVQVPQSYIHQPHLMPEMEQIFSGCVIGRDYPLPIVEHATAYHYAQDQLHALRQTKQARDEAREVIKKHGSRKRPARSRREMGS